MPKAIHPHRKISAHCARIRQEAVILCLQDLSQSQAALISGVSQQSVGNWLHQAEITWSELKTLAPAQLAQREAQDNADAILTARPGAVLRRLGPTAHRQLIGLAHDLDNEARLERVL